MSEYKFALVVSVGMDYGVLHEHAVVLFKTELGAYQYLIDQLVAAKQIEESDIVNYRDPIHLSNLAEEWQSGLGVSEYFHVFQVENRKCVDFTGVKDHSKFSGRES